jgi:ubiquitin-like-conjugating enzyme ATG10
MTTESTVEYHILLSQTYRVPVLYFFLRNLPVMGPKGINAVYEFLVPHQFRSELRAVGVVGAISIGVSTFRLPSKSDPH